MQAAVSRWLLQAKGIAAQEEWVKACVEWILTEEGSRTSQQKLKELIYEQWLHADLRDVAAQPSVPDGVGQKQECQISRKAVVQEKVGMTGYEAIAITTALRQVDSIMDVGASAYGQLQKLKGQSLDTADTPKNTSDPKPTRLLLLSLTDGVSDFQAMEYQPIPHLNSQTLPGTKLLLQGNIDCRLGVLLLAGANVQVLGGSVEQLVERNKQKRLLARALNNENLAEENRPASDTRPLESNQQPASAGQPPDDRTPDARLSSPDSDVVIVDVVPGADLQHQRPPAGCNRVRQRGRGGGESNSRPGGPSSQPRGQSHEGSRECDVVAIHSAVTDTSSRTAGPGICRSGSSLQSVKGSGRYEGVECRITREHSAVTDREQYNDGVVAEDLDVDVGDMDFDDFDNFDAQEEHRYGEQGAQIEVVDHRDVPTVGSSRCSVRNEETVPTATKAPATDAFMETEASWWRSSDAILPKSSETHQKPLNLKLRNFKPEFVNAQVENSTNEVKATMKPPIASVKPMPVANSASLMSRKNRVIPGEFKGVETLHKSLETPFHARGSPFVAGSEKPALFKLSDVCSGSVWKTSPVVRVKAHFIKVVEKLAHAGGEWMVTVLIGDDTGAKLHVHLSNEILELLIGFTAEEFKQNIEPYKSNPAVKARGSRGFRRCQSALADLNCFMELRKRTFHRYPFVEKLLDYA